MKAVTEELERVRELLRLFDEQDRKNGSALGVKITLGLLLAARRHLEVAIGIVGRVK